MQWRTFTFGFNPGGASPADYWYLGGGSGVHVGNTLVRTLVEVEYGMALDINIAGNDNVIPPCGVACGVDLNPDGPIDTSGNVFEVLSRDWLWTGAIGANYTRQVGALDSNIDVINYRFTWMTGHTAAAESVKGQRKINAEDWGIGFNWQFMGPPVGPTGLPVPDGVLIRGTAYVRTLWRF